MYFYKLFFKIYRGDNFDSDSSELKLWSPAIFLETGRHWTWIGFIYPSSNGSTSSLFRVIIKTIRELTVTTSQLLITFGLGVPSVLVTTFSTHVSGFHRSFFLFCRFSTTASASSKELKSEVMIWLFSTIPCAVLM